MVPVEGLEPPLTCVKQILSLSRLPFRHTGIFDNQRLMRDASANKAIMQVPVVSGLQLVITDYAAMPSQLGMRMIHGFSSRLAGK